MSTQVLEIYRTTAIPCILQAALKMVGQPATTLNDADAYKRMMVESVWNQLPGAVRMLGRQTLRWEEALAAAKVLFATGPDGKIAVRQDGPQRLAEMIVSLLSSPPAPKAAPLQATLVARAPVATPLATASPPKAAAAPIVAAPGQANASVGPEIAIGIDLGTTYSAVAYVDPSGRPTTITNAAGDLITPSVVLFDDDGPIVGKEAVAAAALEPERVAQCAKRDMGLKEYRKPINGSRMPPEVISSVILKSLVGDARRRLGPQINKAVITVPAYFDERRRRATIDAGRIAGIEVLDIINEPTAAALAFGFQRGYLDPSGTLLHDKPLTVLVYDLGGGTFDVSIVKIQGRSFQTLATDGDVTLGGKDFDEMIVDHAAEAFQEKFGIDPRTNLACLMDMMSAAEAAKKTLTERAKASLVVALNDKRLKIDVTREEFEELTDALVSRTKTTTQIVMRQTNLDWGQIDTVLLVGGSTRMPMIARMLEQLTGKSCDRSVSPDEAVAHGAAMYAKLLLARSSSTASEFSITNVNSHSLGIIGVDPAGRRRTAILIPKNTPLPATITRVFKTNKSNQPIVVIRVVEGESEKPEACIQVGVCRIEELPANLPQGTPVHVSYSYQENGQLEVLAQIEGAAKVRTIFHRENTIDREDMGKWTDFVNSL